MRDHLNKGFASVKGFADRPQYQFELYQPHPDTGVWGADFEKKSTELRRWGLARDGSVHRDVLRSLDAFLAVNPGVRFFLSINMMIQFEAMIVGMDGVTRSVRVVYQGLSKTGIRLLIDATEF